LPIVAPALVLLTWVVALIVVITVAVVAQNVMSLLVSTNIPVRESLGVVMHSVITLIQHDAAVSLVKRNTGLR
jgi:hypothetical protein